MGEENKEIDVNKVAADARRIAEQAKKSVDIIQKKNDEMAKKAGFENLDDMFEQIFAEKDKDALEKFASGDTEALKEVIKSAIEKVPEISDIRQMSEEYRQKEQEAAVKRDIEELNRIHPDAKIKDLEDIKKLEDGMSILILAGNGVPLHEAYGKFFKPQASQASKEHLKTFDGGKGGNTVPPIPQADYVMYKDQWPDEPEEKLRERYWRVQERQNAGG